MSENESESHVDQISHTTYLLDPYIDSLSIKTDDLISKQEKLMDFLSALHEGKISKT